MYFNRELSWLKFNERVLMEGNNLSLPLYERAKFSAIFSSNLDEFFMVRVASVKDQINLKMIDEKDDGYTPQEVFEAIYREVSKLVELQADLTDELMQALSRENMNWVGRKSFNRKIVSKLKSFFYDQVFPVLTPIGIDMGRPFPLISNKRIYIAVKLMVDMEARLALVEVPSVLERVKRIDDDKFVLLEDVIEEFVSDLFPGNEIIETTQFRVTRNGDFQLLKDESDDLLMVIEEAVKLRKWGDAIRLEVRHDIDEWLLNQLSHILSIEAFQCYRIRVPLDQTYLSRLPLPKHSKDLLKRKYKANKFYNLKKKNLFDEIREHDLFFHHPYDSFDYIIEFIKQASKDPQVLAIKQTLYRVSGHSDIVKALGRAAERGKQVTVLVELMARFDEENNINWAKKLEEKGAHVIYGIYGLKTHSKITLVVRKEYDEIKRYVHLGTGNYNNTTAKLYTDMGYLTAKENYGTDASIFFNYISGFSNDVHTNILTMAPNDLRNKFYQLIDREIEFAREGKKTHIIAKMNALVDKGVVDKLYDASQAGVRIELIVRGSCSLVPGLHGLSDNIKVISIVGEFLEHSRIYYFHNNGNQEMYLSSADWMTRNLDRRVELLFPISDEMVIRRIRQTLCLYLLDNQKSWRLDKEGNYKKVISKGKNYFSHEVLKNLDYRDTEEFNYKINNFLKENERE